MPRIKTLSKVDTSRHQKFFSSFEIRDCWKEMGPVVQATLKRTIERCTRPGTRERRKALYRHDNPAGNLFSLCFGLSEHDRFTYVVQFIEFLCIIDDVLEDLPHAEALIEHEILCEALGGPKDSSPARTTENTRVEWIYFLKDLQTEILTVDPIRSPALLLTFGESLRARDSSADDFNTIEQYLPYRLINFDYEFVTQLILWAMDVDISSADIDQDVFNDYKRSIGVIVGLVNDYFSWEREKQQQAECDRIRNGVSVLMKQYRLSDKEAKARVKEMLVEEESKARWALSHLGKRSRPMQRYIDGLATFAGGYSFWCATCPRYSKPQVDLGETRT